LDSLKITEIAEADSQQVNQLVSEAFEYPSGQHYFDDFPVWGSSGVIRIGGYSGNRLISHVGIQYRRLKAIEASGGSSASSVSHRVALIGAVATRDAFRGMGIGSKMMSEAIRRIDEQGCDWSFLWGSEHTFYARFGFHLEGTQRRALLSDLFMNDASRGGSHSGHSIEIQHGFCDRIFEDFISRTDGIVFDRMDREWLSKQNTVQWLWTDQPFAYVAYERGMDLKEMVHEFGGDRDGVLKLLRHLAERNPGAQLLASNAQWKAFGFADTLAVHESLCLARPGAPNLRWDPQFWISGLSAV